MTLWWSFVNSKKNEVYIWLAIDRDSRKIVGCFVGDRTRKSARQLWDSLQMFINNVPLLIPIFGKPIQQLFPLNVIALLVKSQVKLIILND
ncbi:MAG: hypothetical protein CLLPBCKN_001466 [Chroococcidiopsis cubana SAG 39.79]|nr:hypothetical protein [Chroococcidiopsis cubana SAG 39.79]